MVWDRYTKEFHLTPRGWEKGTMTFFGNTNNPIPRPKDAVLTVKKEVEQSWGGSPEDIDWSTEWTSDDEAAVKRLTKKFGVQPE